MLGSALERLEFPALKEILRQRLTCAPGGAALERLEPSADREWIETELARVAEARAFLEEDEELGFGGLIDPATWLPKLPVGNVILPPEALLDATTLLETSTATRTQLGAPRFRSLLPRLRELAAALTDFTAQTKDIRRRILPGGEIDDHASPALAEVRTAISKTEEKLHRALRRLLRQAAAQAALQDEFVTLRGGRLVLPIRSDARSRPEGVVHAQSGTGHTLFLEPFATIALNNDLVRLREDEAAEIRKILRGLTERLAARLPQLERAVEVIGQLDLTFARARYAREFHCTIPRFDAGHTVTLTAVRHPLLVAAALEAARTAKKEKPGQEATDGAKDVVPISLALSQEKRVLVISGPNAGGKTVALKTLGLAALAAQAGVPVPAEEVVLPVFEQVLADIGDLQSIAENLSTFSAHIVNLRRMAEEAGEHSLVLLDELGAATSPEEGAALGIALLEHFRRRGALTVATTHHERLKAYAASTSGALNAAVEFDEVNLRPTYRLLLDVPGVSSGIEMSARLGLPEEIVTEARQKLTVEAAENAEMIRSLHRSQQELEKLQGEVRGELERVQSERERLEQEWLKLQKKKLDELDRQVQGIVTAARKELRAAVDVARDPSTGLKLGAKQRERLERTGMRQLGKVEAEVTHEVDTTIVEKLGEAARPRPVRRRVKPEELVVGARVKLRGIARRGVVLSKTGADTAEVQVGSLRMRVRADDVEAVETEKGKRAGKVTVQKTSTAETSLDFTRGKQSAQRMGVPELHVRGLRVEEAREKVDKFLDDAVLGGQSEVCIVHGIGSGALKKALAEFLAEHPHVASIKEAEREHGGAGVTVVTLQSRL